MDLFVEKIGAKIVSERLIKPSDNVVVAFSGGADSTALLVVLTQLGYRCVAAHCNFHLRGVEADRDEAHCRKIAERLGIVIEVAHFRAEDYSHEHKISIEMACRELRYRWFAEVCDKYGAKTLAVGHHRNDDEETFLLNLIRGTGIAGLTGMAYSRRLHNGSDIAVVRPLLDVERCEIEAFLQRENLPFVVDSTNLENDYMRNKVRNELLPMMRKLFPNADKGISTTIDNLSAYSKVAEALINEKVDESFDETTGRLSLSKIADEELKKEIIYRVANGFGFSRHQVEDMAGEHQSGARFCSDKAEAVVNQGDLVFSKFTETEDEEKYVVEDLTVGIPDQLHITAEMIRGNSVTIDFQRDGAVAYFDADVMSANGPFVFRHWREGDRLEPFGMNGSRLLSDIFTDLKLTPNQRRKVWIMVDGNNRILWVVGIRASRHYKVTSATENIIRLTLTK